METNENLKTEWPPEVAAKQRGAVIGFVLVLVLSMVTTAVYVAGRTPATGSQPAPAVQTARAPESSAPPVAPAPAPAAPALPRPAPPAEAGPRRLAAGTHLQVGAVDMDSAKRMVRELKRVGLAASIKPGPSETIFRVAVGPLETQQEADEARAILSANGLQMFPRRF